MAGCIEFCISRLIHTKYLSPFFGIRKFNSSPSFLLSFAFICKTLSASDSDFILGHRGSSFASDTGRFSSQCRAVVPTPAEVGHMVSMSFISPDLSFPMCRVCFVVVSLSYCISSDLTPQPYGSNWSLCLCGYDHVCVCGYMRMCTCAGQSVFLDGSLLYCLRQNRALSLGFLDSARTARPCILLCLLCQL